MIDELRLFGRALSVSEVSSYANRNVDTACSNPNLGVGAWEYVYGNGTGYTAISECLFEYVSDAQIDPIRFRVAKTGTIAGSVAFYNNDELIGIDNGPNWLTKDANSLWQPLPGLNYLKAVAYTGTDATGPVIGTSRKIVKSTTQCEKAVPTGSMVGISVMRGGTKDTAFTNQCPYSLDVLGTPDLDLRGDYDNTGATTIPVSVEFWINGVFYGVDNSKDGTNGDDRGFKIDQASAVGGTATEWEPNAGITYFIEAKAYDAVDGSAGTGTYLGSSFAKFVAVDSTP
jgi:hypothetical protein